MVLYFQKIMDEGTSNPIVARIDSQLNELMQLCRIDKKKKENLSFIFHEMMKEVLAANKQAIPLIEELQLINENHSNNGLILEAHKHAIPSSMKLDDIKIFLKHANATLKLLAQALAVFFDKGWIEAKFNDILGYIENEQNRLNERWQLVHLIRDNLDWLQDIVELRNVDEHKYYKRQKKDALVKNYTLSEKEDKLILLPPKLCNDQVVLPFLLDANQRLFLLCEEITVATIALFLPNPVSICEIPEEQRVKNFPKRFKHCLHSFVTFPAHQENLEHKGYTGNVLYDSDAKIFHGEVLGIKDVITFQSTKADGINQAFKDSVDDYLTFCKKRGEEPTFPLSP